MRYTAIFLFLFSSNLFGQLLDQDLYIDITKIVLSDSTVIKNVIEYSDFESHSIYEVTRIFILDTVNFDRELIFNNNIPSFIISDINEMKTSYVNYWIYPTEISLKKNMIDYKYKTQSLYVRDSVNYIQGHIRLKKIKGNWIISKSRHENYEFRLPQSTDCYEQSVVCNSSINRPEKSESNNPFFGDWHYIFDSSYVEAFFTDDTLYRYSVMGHKLDLKYTLSDSFFSIYDSDSVLGTLSYQVLDKNRIKVYGVYESIWGNDTTVQYVEYVTKRIRKSDYKYSDVNCWGRFNESDHCYIDSQDGIRYQKAFYKRYRNIFRVSVMTKTP